MVQFEPLSAKLANYFETPYSRLPKNLKAEVEEAFPFRFWNRYKPVERVEITYLRDLERDPETSRKDLHDLNKLSAQIEKVESRLRREAIKRWNLKSTGTVPVRKDKDLEARNFRPWFYEW